MLIISNETFLMSELLENYSTIYNVNDVSVNLILNFLATNYSPCSIELVFIIYT